MKFALIGIPAAFQSRRIETAAAKAGRVSDDARAGFTLIEVLVALALLLAFTSALGPLTFESQRILIQGDGQVRAELLLRNLLDTGFDRTNPITGSQRGETAGFDWRLDIDPFVPGDDARPADAKKGEISWGLFRITAYVFWGSRQIVTAQTMQLGRLN